MALKNIDFGSIWKKYAIESGEKLDKGWTKAGERVEK
jgi:hypothetical protein